MLVERAAELDVRPRRPRASAANRSLMCARVLADVCMNVDDHGGNGGEGGEMKITGIETLPVSVGAGYDYAVIIVLVRTDEGLTGIGEASLAGRGRGVLGILDHFAELLVGQDPARIEHWWGEMVRGTFWSTGQVIMSAVAGIDIALWDLKGKRLGVPVYEPPRRPDARAGARLPPPRGRPRRGARRGRAALARAGVHGAPLRPARRLRRARADAVGSAAVDRARRSRPRRPCATRSVTDVDLLLDAHTMFSPAEAAYLGHALEPYRLYFYEDPIRPLNPLSLRLVREKVNLPIATGEQLAHKWEFQPLIENELVDYLRIDLVHAGGITEAKKILATGEVHGQRSALHHASSPVNGVGLPPRRHGGAELRDPGVDGARAAVRALPERAARRGRLRRAARGPGLGLELDEAEARRRPSRDAPLPSRPWPDGGVADY